MIALASRFDLLNGTHDIHSFDYFSERSKALSIRIPLAAEIELRLIADTNKELT